MNDLHLFSVLRTLALCALVSVLGARPYSAAAQTEPPSAQVNRDEAERVRNLLIEAERKGVASFGCMLTAAESGETLFAYGAERSMIPASTTKLFTTAAATLLLDEYPFITDFRITGKVKGTTLYGDLLFVGSGDPSLYSKYFPADSARFRESLLASLRAHHIERIEGSVGIIASAYDSLGFNPLWMGEDRGEWYANGIYGFNIFDNWIDLTLSSGKGTYDVSLLKTYPPRTGVEWDNRLTTTQKGSFAEGDGLPLVERRTLKGSVPRNRSRITLSTDMPHPPLYAARFLTNLLQAHGVEVVAAPYASFTAPMASGRLIGRYYGPAKSNLLRATNYHSLNHYAEALLKAIARDEAKRKADQAQQPLPASVAAGLACEKQLFTKAGIRFSPLFRLTDGSGLARANRFTAGDMTKLLSYMIRQDVPLFEEYLYSLPEAGSEGTVRRFLGNKPYRTFLKSGSMRGVQCYAGYIDYKGKQYIVALFANDLRDRARVRTLFAAVADLVLL